MARIVLRDALYTPMNFPARGFTIADSAVEIRDVISMQVSNIGSGKEYDYSDSSQHYFCSTMMDTVFSSGSMALMDIAPFASRPEICFTNAYECACWGYCMRHHYQHKRGDRYFAISIVDVNSMEMKYWDFNDHWGKSGFGITTLFFENMEGDPDCYPIYTGMASGGNNIISFASFAKTVARITKSDTISLPFFPANMSIPIRRSLKMVDQLTCYHTEFGHAFGSDPWISFIKDICNQRQLPETILFGSLALRGYYCFAVIETPPTVNAQLIHRPL